MKRKITIAIIILCFLGLAMAPGIEAAVIKTQASQENIKATDAPTEIHIGEMRIADGASSITLTYDDTLVVDEGSQLEMYKIIIGYYFKENSINQEKWVFRINITGETSNSPKIYDEKIFIDNWWNNDEGTGELWLDVYGYDLWILNSNLITVECEQWNDILWTGLFGLIDRVSEICFVKTQNFPGPNMTWSCPDGDTWELKNLTSETQTKRFILTNTGGWESKGIKVNLEGSSEFNIVQGETLISLKPGESYQYIVSFTPASYGNKTAEFNTINDAEWYFKGSNLTITGKVEKSKTRIPSYLEILLEKMPILQRILRL